ncbi:ABC transporter ATP-binding protein [Azoarcus sp. KH32C]|uniref:ABC transporter ATP-binding protein n=1 Tax=Azoarcus sp. KH32C TaxID=748247 RepID=UPI000238700D|nr:sn-glycerol-3-phosphate ABC transporter ATP-binding protein UgpC [Azoarcus sp. KH32C]BAL24990.1 ABC transporter, multiple sugar transport system ATP-binding protein [Azoarcus sp. KH32C]
MGALSIRDVRKSYQGTEILKGINIEIEKGEFLILVGPSGCGKSTLLSMIAGLDTVSSGDIRIGDRVVNNLSPKDRDIAMVFQSYALYPSMTVRENISFGLEIRKVGKAEQQKIVERVAQTLQIGHLLDRKPSQLSGGQRQRVAMGRAIARDPSLFLFDEPLSNLDAKLRVEMRVEIKQLHQRMGTTIVYVTHDQIEAMTLGDKIAVMKAGEVQQFGTPQQIYDNPANLFVAGFMGSPSMNFIPARVEAMGAGHGVRLESGANSYVFPAVSANGKLKPWEGKEVVFGIRPEQITHKVESSLGADYIQTASLPISLTEPTGPDTLVLVPVNGREVTCRVHPAHARAPGENMDLMFDLSKAVFFDPASELRIA